MIKKEIKREQNIKENIQDRKKVANQNNNAQMNRPFVVEQPPENANVHIRVCSPQEIQEAVGKLKNRLGLIISYKSEITNLKDRIRRI